MEVLCYTLNENEYLDKAFKRIPSNCNIDKGRCGIGGTSLELTDNRNSIIVVPNISAIESKQKECTLLFGVTAKVSVESISEYISCCLNKKVFIKIMVTPESLNKVLLASKRVNYNVKEDCFLLLDEAHTTITEGGYRFEIRKVFDHFFTFKNKSLISATPFEFSDPRFAVLQSLKINILKSNQNSVNVIFSKSVLPTLISLISSVTTNDGENVHVFYNSVRSITGLIDLLGEDGVSVFCRDNDDNRKTLGIHANLLRDTDKSGFKPTRVNLYTCRYYEAWDLRDNNATIILVSDIDNENTCMSIKNKAIQIIGRLREVKPKGIYHITNVKEEKQMENISTVNSIRLELMTSALEKVDYYNTTLKKSWTNRTRKDVLEALKPAFEKVCDFECDTDKATINHLKIDTETYLELTRTQYLNREVFTENWEKEGYSVVATFDNKQLSNKERKLFTNPRLSKTDRCKLVITKMHELIMHDEEVKRQGLINYAINDLLSLKLENQELFNFYDCLGYEKIVALGFNYTAIKREYIYETVNSTEVTISIAKLLYNRFLSYNFYTSKEIKDFIQEIYDRLNLGKKAKGSNINSYFITTNKKRSIDGKVLDGYLLGMKTVIIK